MAAENRATRRRVRDRSRLLVRTANLHRGDARVVHVHLIIGDDAAALQRLGKTFRLPQLSHERDADDARTGLDGDAKLESGVAADLHVLFPAVVAGTSRLAVAGITRRGGPSLRAAADREPLQQLAIEPHVELLRPAHTLDVVLILPLQPDLDRILAVDGKVAANRDPAARSERQLFALAVVLHHMQWNLEGLDPRTGRRQTGCLPRHLSRDRQVALEMRG